MSADQKTMLIFEPLTGGHRANFIRWLRAGLLTDSNWNFVFFTAGDVKPETAEALKTAGRWKKQQLLWTLFRQACEKIKPDHVLILELTHLESPLALFGSPHPVSAVLFVQYPELPRGLKFLFKHWKTALLLRRGCVRNLFLLNGENACDWLASRFGSRSRFIPVPDPVPEAVPEAGFSLRSYFEIGAERKVFLFFGSLSPRKGADVLMDSLRRLDPQAAARSAFVFCGEPEPVYRQTFEQACGQLRAARPDISLFTENHFVSDSRMMALFDQSDVVLMPYTRPEYSSGILALAAGAGVPVIGPAAGLLGRLIRDNGLGITCPVQPEALSEAIASASASLPVTDSNRRAAFVRKSRPEEFSRIILNTICHES
jgi:glycosyltransferase involved in cell wall biosynthesis